MPEVTLAYIAGLIDGEGTITIRRHNRGKGHTVEEYGAWISMAQKEREILDWLKSVVECGSVVKHTFKGDRWGSPIMHHWAVGYDAAYQLILALRPYLRVKHKQADLVIEFQELKRSFRDRSIKGMRGRIPTSPEMLAEYRRLCEAVQTLNGRKVVHTGPRTPTEGGGLRPSQSRR